MLQYSSFQQTLWWYFLSLLVALLGSRFTDRNFYKIIKRPSWAPPPWLFSIWLVLYLLQAQASYFIQRELNSWGFELWLYIAYLIVSIFWSVSFFYLKTIGISVIVIVVNLILAILVNIFYFNVYLISGFLFLPTVLWITFATILNISIYRLNIDVNIKCIKKNKNYNQCNSENSIDMKI